MIFPTL